MNDDRIVTWRTLPERWRPDHDVFAFHEDTNANAVLITASGEVFAVAEERLTRNRFQGGFPARSLEWLEKISGRRAADAPQWIFGNRTHFLPRLLGRGFPSFEHDFFGAAHKAMLLYHGLLWRFPSFMRVMSAFNRGVASRRAGRPAFMVDHHYAHAASAYYTSGFAEACVVSADNYGDGYSAKVYDGNGADLRFIHGASALRSPGQFYGEIAQVAGIHPLLAGKLTGLAAHGDPVTARDRMKPLFNFEKAAGDFSSTFGLRRSRAREPFSSLATLPREDLAAAAQERLEIALVEYVRRALSTTGRRRIALAGGCFANVRVNQIIRELPGVDEVWIHPAMSDQGIAFGAALAYIAHRRRALPFRMEGVLIGPEPEEAEIEAALRRHGFHFDRPMDVEIAAARLLADGAVLARIAGPMEYGPRALGNRSVFHEPTDPGLQARLNAKLRRSAYMPFAPVILAEDAERCVKEAARALDSGRFMTMAFDATDWMKARCPGVVHVDGTVRPQLLRREDNPPVYRMIEEFRRLTGIPCLVNTSFNLHSEPIVAGIEDACASYVASELDAMIAGPFLVRRMP